MLSIYFIVLVQLAVYVCEINRLVDGQPNVITVIKKKSAMGFENEKRDEVVLRLLRTVEKQSQDMTTMVKQMEKRDIEIKNRDIILTGLLEEVKDQNKALTEITSDVRRISEIMMKMIITHSQCKNLYPINGTYARIKYPRSGKYGNDLRCEWNIRTSENVSLTFPYFDMYYDAESYYATYDFVAVYVGESKIGQWDTTTEPPPVLNLKGDIKILFHSGYPQQGIRYHSTGFEMVMQPLKQ